jgi:hypothetical protein
MLAMKIDCHKGLISHDEFSAFIKGEFLPAGALEFENCIKVLKELVEEHVNNLLNFSCTEDTIL